MPRATLHLGRMTLKRHAHCSSTRRPASCSVALYAAIEGTPASKQRGQQRARISHFVELQRLPLFERFARKAIEQGDRNMVVRGGCLCRSIEFEADRPFLKFVNVNAPNAEGQAGSAFAANAYVPPQVRSRISINVRRLKILPPRARRSIMSVSTSMPVTPA